MFGALKFIPRDAVEKESSEKLARKRKDKERGKEKIRSRGKKKRRFESDDSSSSSSDDDDERPDRGDDEVPREIREEAKAKRKEAGMDWMLRAPERLFDKPAPPVAKDPSTIDPEVHS